jgi:hypothetical protein
VTPQDGERPLLRVIRGDASDEELAAVVALLAAASGGDGAGTPDDGTVSTWSAHGYAHRNIRATFASSAHGWRTSYWPR